MVFYLIYLLLLQRAGSYPKIGGESEEQAAIRQWSEVGRAMLTNQSAVNNSGDE